MKILFAFGTRPEAIKLAPIITEAKKLGWVNSVVCVTGQHRGMLDQVLDIFAIKPDYDLNIMEDDQDLVDVVAKCVTGIRGVLEKATPDLVIVQGDTTSAFAAGLAAYYLKIPVAHVEAGLRTYNKYSPFPEEINRRLLSILADYHFAPTRQAKHNLIKEGIPSRNIWVTGNTVTDALLITRKRQLSAKTRAGYLKFFKLKCGLDIEKIEKDKKIILVTGHRRENFGEKFKNICNALKDTARRRPDAVIVYPIHLNPNVQKPVRSILSGIPNIYLIEPLGYGSFVFLMSVSYFLLTDSGGIQEEAPSLGKPVLLMRDRTERPEGIKAGVTKIVGTSKERIVKHVCRLLNDKKAYRDMTNVNNPYGDGKVAGRILSILRKATGIQPDCI